MLINPALVWSFAMEMQRKRDVTRENVMGGKNEEKQTERGRKEGRNAIMKRVRERGTRQERMWRYSVQEKPLPVD